MKDAASRTFRASGGTRTVAWLAVTLGVVIVVAGLVLVTSGRFGPGSLVAVVGLLVLGDGLASACAFITVSPDGIRSRDLPRQHRIDRDAITGITVSGRYAGEEPSRVLVERRAGDPIALPALSVWVRGKRSRERAKAMADVIRDVLDL